MMILHVDSMKIFHENTSSDSIQQVIEPQLESETKTTPPPRSIITDPIPKPRYNLRKTIRMPDRYRAN
jgi:hypothetical protein